MKSKEERIHDEEIRLSEYFKSIPKHKLKAAEGLIQNCAFMRVTLDDLQLEIMESGSTEIYVHGANQRGVKASASLQAYEGIMKLYTSATKELLRIMPKTDESSTDDLKTELEKMIETD